MSGAPAASVRVTLSSADRVLFPDDGITKGDLFAYYEAVASFIVPHLRNRPFTMKRWREGLPGGSFFQKQAPKGMPSWIPRRRFGAPERACQSKDFSSSRAMTTRWIWLVPS